MRSNAFRVNFVVAFIDAVFHVQSIETSLVQFSGHMIRSNGPIVKMCWREDFVPHCDEEMQESVQGRHADLQAAVERGHFQAVARISQSMTSAATMPSAVANFVGSMAP